MVRKSVTENKTVEHIGDFFEIAGTGPRSDCGERRNRGRSGERLRYVTAERDRRARRSGRHAAR